jgi:hypothetical protein
MYVRSMVEAGTVAGLAGTPPGPALSARLATIDPAGVPADAVVEVLRAQARQCAHEQARLWAGLVAVGLAAPEAVGAAQPTTDPWQAMQIAAWAPGEISAALTWTAGPPNTNSGGPR